jgi:hypothetical protein
MNSLPARAYGGDGKEDTSIILEGGQVHLLAPVLQGFQGHKEQQNIKKQTVFFHGMLAAISPLREPWILVKLMSVARVQKIDGAWPVVCCSGSSVICCNYSSTNCTKLGHSGGVPTPQQHRGSNLKGWSPPSKGPDLS